MILSIIHIYTYTRHTIDSACAATGCPGDGSDRADLRDRRGLSVQSAAVGMYIGYSIYLYMCGMRGMVYSVIYTIYTMSDIYVVYVVYNEEHS